MVEFFSGFFKPIIESSLIQGMLSVVVIAIKLYAFWLPVLLLYAFWRIWIAYVQSAFIASQQCVLLEFKLPKEILKTPLAMEQVFSSLYLTSGESTFIDRAWSGKVRAWFSFELVSIEGQVHFFVWTREGLRNYLEAQIYANYPNVEVHQVEDYAKSLRFNPAKNSVWGCDIGLSKPDPYPIKTYVDYGLDKEQVEDEYKVDPIAPIVEFLGSMKKGEVMAIQMITRAHKKRFFPEGLIEREDKWKDDAKKEIEKIRKEATPKIEGLQFPGFPNPTKGQTETIAALERSVAKYGFDVGIRVMYFADNENFRGGNISTMLSMFKQFGSNNLNGFMPKRWLADFDYPWQDFMEIRQNAARRKFLKAWKRRAYFHSPFRFKPAILNTEELATIYHFPGGRSVETPTFNRIPSKKGGAPSNIPI